VTGYAEGIPPDEIGRIYDLGGIPLRRMDCQASKEIGVIAISLAASIIAATVARGRIRPAARKLWAAYPVSRTALPLTKIARGVLIF
jgi:hypothetical protein